MFTCRGRVNGEPGRLDHEPSSAVRRSPLAARRSPLAARRGGLLEFDLVVRRMPWGTECPGGFRRCERSVVSSHRLVGLLDGTQPGSDPGFAGGDSLAV